MDYLSINEINKFIENTYKLYCEYERSIFLVNNDNESIYSLISNFGPVKALYLNKDKNLSALLNKKCDYKKLIDLITIFCKETNNIAKRMYNECGISYETAIIKYGYKEIEFSSNEDPVEFTNKVNNLILDKLNNEEKNVKESFLYLYFSYEYRDRNLEQGNIEKLYDDLDYGLITINDDRNILFKYNRICNYPRIYDILLNKTIFIQIGMPLLNLFMRLYKEQIVKKLSFRGINHMIFPGKNEREILQESKDIGKYFSYDIDKLPKVSKISDYNYRNKLIVVHKENNLFFEEISNAYINNKDFVETQIIHFEFNISKKIITHLDHEYVYYTKSEFSEKENILNRKGTYKKKYKTFKLDECSIPIDYMCDSYMKIDRKKEEIKVPLIFYIVNEIFEHKDLLNEYFSSVRNNLCKN